MISYIKLKEYSFLKIFDSILNKTQKKTVNSNIFLTIDYNDYHSLIDSHYNEYLKIVKDLHSELKIDFYFQKYPNLRYNTSSDNFPVWHTDKHFGHHIEEINVMIPITKDEFGFEIIGITSHILKHLNTKILNSKIGKYFLNLISTKYNYLDEIIIFDSYHLHTASNRKEYKNPRVSIDLRVLPVNHKPEYNTSLRGISFKPGHYFSEHPISYYIKE